MQMLTNVQPLLLTIALLMRLVKTPLVHIPVHATVAILGVETCAPVSHRYISFKFSVDVPDWPHIYVAPISVSLFLERISVFFLAFECDCHYSEADPRGGGGGGRAPSPQKFQPCFFAAWHAVHA